MGTDRYQIIQPSDYPTIPTFTKVLTAIFCYLSYTCTLQIIIAVFICISAAGLGSSGSSLFEGSGGLGNLLSYYSDAEGPGDCGSGVFIAEEADGIVVEILLVTDLYAGLPHLRTIPQLQKYQDFWRINIQIKGILF